MNPRKIQFHLKIKWLISKVPHFSLCFFNQFCKTYWIYKLKYYIVWEISNFMRSKEDLSEWFGETLSTYFLLVSQGTPTIFQQLMVNCNWQCITTMVAWYYLMGDFRREMSGHIPDGCEETKFISVADTAWVD